MSDFKSTTEKEKIRKAFLSFKWVEGFDSATIARFVNFFTDYWEKGFEPKTNDLFVLYSQLQNGLYPVSFGSGILKSDIPYLKKACIEIVKCAINMEAKRDDLSK